MEGEGLTNTEVVRIGYSVKNVTSNGNQRKTVDTGQSKEKKYNKEESMAVSLWNDTFTIVFTLSDGVYNGKT